jgi:hypothetical protein
MSAQYEGDSEVGVRDVIEFRSRFCPAACLCRSAQQ